MQGMLRERDQGQRHAGSRFKGGMYERMLPTLRQTGTLELHTGCVNHISFSESGHSYHAAPCPSQMRISNTPDATLLAILFTEHVKLSKDLQGNVMMQVTRCSVAQTTRGWESGMLTRWRRSFPCALGTMPTSSAPASCLAQVSECLHPLPL